MTKKVNSLKKKKDTSSKQIAACRANSRKSTGPKNTTVTRLNSTRHGMVSVLIDQENKPEFESLYVSLHEELQPNSSLEEEVFSDIVFALWRLRRGRIAEKIIIQEPSVSMHLRTEEGEIVFEDYSIQTILKYENSARRQLSKMLRLFYDTQERRLGKGNPSDT